MALVGSVSPNSESDGEIAALYSARDFVTLSDASPVLAEPVEGSPEVVDAVSSSSVHRGSAIKSYSMRGNLEGIDREFLLELGFRQGVFVGDCSKPESLRSLGSHLKGRLHVSQALISPAAGFVSDSPSSSPSASSGGRKRVSFSDFSSIRKFDRGSSSKTVKDDSSDTFVPTSDLSAESPDFALSPMEHSQSWVSKIISIVLLK